jgi:quercetin dioxygenase-like cupin family protein
MQSWDLRTPSGDGRGGQRALFATAATRMEVVDLGQNEELGNRGNGGRLVIEVLSGSVDLTIGGDTTRWGDGMLVVLEPGEPRLVRALESSRLLLTCEVSRSLVTFAPPSSTRAHAPTPR